MFLLLLQTKWLFLRASHLLRVRMPNATTGRATALHGTLGGWHINEEISRRVCVCVVCYMIKTNMMNERVWLTAAVHSCNAPWCMQQRHFCTAQRLLNNLFFHSNETDEWKMCEEASSDTLLFSHYFWWHASQSRYCCGFCNITTSPKKRAAKVITNTNHVFDIYVSGGFFFACR